MTIAFASMVFAWRTVRHSKAQTPVASDRVADHAPDPLSAASLSPPSPSPPAARTATAAPSGAAAAMPADGPARGWLRIGGATLVGARVTADGAFLGFVPLEVSLPAGAHVIQVTSAGGRALVRKRIHLREAQTRVAPLRILR